VRRILIAPLAPFFSPGPPPGHRIGGVSYLQAGCGLALGQLSPLPLQRLDLRNFYRDMREALITANRRAGAQQGLVTKARKKIAKLEVELSRLERERDDLISYRQRVEREANEISAMLPRLKARLLQVRQIEQALENLADIKEAVDQQERADAVEFFEETVEDIESKPESESDRDSSSDNSPESGEASDER
jgi:chromosome segregation ATPase